MYDEVHYLRDSERGVVWEESICLAPKKCRMAFLSATLPNAAEFASWVAGVHASPCHVVYTDYRPTPLQHYIFPAGEGLVVIYEGLVIVCQGSVVMYKGVVIVCQGSVIMYEALVIMCEGSVIMCEGLCTRGCQV